MLISILKRYPKQSQVSGYVPAVTSSTGSNTTGNITVLQTNGTQFILNGTRFVGPYHIHSDGQAYAGDATNHADGSEVLLTPIPGAGSNTGSGSYNTTLSATGPVVQTPAGQLVTPTSNVTPAGSPLPPTPNVPYSVQQEYIDNGLTFKSNNQYVIDRDSAGNMKLQISASSNQNLIIEPAIENFTNASFINAVDTQFNYFKFPASIKAPDIPEATIDDINFNLNTADGITARYAVPYEEDNLGQPKTNRALNVYGKTKSFFSNFNDYNKSNNTNYWFPDDTAVTITEFNNDESLTTSAYRNGYAKIPFSQKIVGNGDQLEPGTFTLTQDMIDRLQENNQTIKFRIRLQVTKFTYSRVESTNRDPALSGGNPDTETVVIYQGNETGEAKLRLNRSMPTIFRNFNAPVDEIGASNPLTSSNPFGELQLDYIIDIKNDAEALDKYSVSAAGRQVMFTVANRPFSSPVYGLSYNRDVSYWEISVIDDPGSGYGKQTI